jgi:hypothetical protein
MLTSSVPLQFVVTRHAFATAASTINSHQREHWNSFFASSRIIPCFGTSFGLRAMWLRGHRNRAHPALGDKARDGIQYLNIFSLAIGYSIR